MQFGSPVAPSHMPLWRRRPAMMPRSGFRSLIRDLRDKIGTDASPPNRGGGKRGGARNHGSQTPKPYDPSRMPMSHGWIKLRLGAAVKDERLVQKIRYTGYSRHVLFFSVPHGVAHSEALLRHIANGAVRHQEHAAHPVTQEWLDHGLNRLSESRRMRSTGGPKR